MPGADEALIGSGRGAGLGAAAYRREAEQGRDGETDEGHGERDGDGPAHLELLGGCPDAPASGQAADPLGPDTLGPTARHRCPKSPCAGCIPA